MCSDTSEKLLLYLKIIYTPLKIFKTLCNKYTHIRICIKHAFSPQVSFAETSLKTATVYSIYKSVTGFHSHTFLFSNWMVEISSQLYVRQVTVITYTMSTIWYVNMLQPLSYLEFQLTVNMATCMVCFYEIAKQ